MGCSRAPRCGADYQSRVSGPLLDRIDLHVEVDPVSALDLTMPHSPECSEAVAARVASAHAIQKDRLRGTAMRSNADLSGEALDHHAAPDEAGQALLVQAATRLKLSARGYTRILRVARTIADLNAAPSVTRTHIAEALSYRRQAPLA